MNGSHPSGLLEKKLPSLSDLLVKVKHTENVPLGTGLAERAKKSIRGRKEYQQWVLEDPDNRSHISFQEWQSGDTDD